MNSEDPFRGTAREQHLHMVLQKWWKAGAMFPSPPLSRPFLLIPRLPESLPEERSAICPVLWLLHMGCNYCSKHQTICKRIIYRAFLLQEPLTCGNSVPICPNTHFLSLFDQEPWYSDSTWPSGGKYLTRHNPLQSRGDQPSPSHWGRSKVSAPSWQPFSAVTSLQDRK